VTLQRAFRKYQALAWALAASLVAGAGYLTAEERQTERKEYRLRDGSDSGSRGTNSWSGSRYRFPTEFLRELLAAAPADRDKLLAERAERDRKFNESFYRSSKSMSEEEKQQKVEKRVQDSQQFWQAKIREYEALTPEQREQRIGITERMAMLREHLTPLMKLPAVERTERLARVPEADRPLVERRLNIWDSLPAGLQSQVLEHNSALHYFARLESTPPELRPGYLDRLPSHIRRKLEEDIHRWQDLPADQREVMQRQFAALFKMPESEKEKTLDFLPEPERRKLEQALGQFDQLPPDQRRKCMDAYKTYSNMSPEQRQQFLINAERWKNMSEEEKAVWRAMAAKLPPLPPGMNTPPLPPGMKAPPAPPVPAAQPHR
jgi:hypothetical protein